MNSRRSQNTQLVKAMAKRYGFVDVTIARADFMAPEARRLEQWLAAGYQGKMHYLANYFDKRVDPRKLVPGAKSVIVLSYNYFTHQKQHDNSAPKIAMYALGDDYHRVIRNKLKALIDDLSHEIGAIEGRCFVDSAPVLERDWARRSGHGWIGKNTLLLTKKRGSYFFLATIISDMDLVADNPVSDHCGSCTRCIDACPTGAIDNEGSFVDASRCISYLTIELKDEIPKEFKGLMDNWAFGCDICQQVCPWNRFSTPHQESAFGPRAEILSMSKKEWVEMTDETFKKVFRQSAVKRTKYKGLMRNVRFLES